MTAVQNIPYEELEVGQKANFQRSVTRSKRNWFTASKASSFCKC